MVHRIFLDTNVFLNIILDEYDCDNCLALLDRLNSEEGVELFIGYLSFPNIAYVLRKSLCKQKTLSVLKKIRSKVKSVLPGTDLQILLAEAAVKGPDYEDVLQYLCAREGGCDILVSCNTKHFLAITEDERVGKYMPQPGKIDILTPEEALRVWR